MKKVVLITTFVFSLVFISTAPALADVYVGVDANGVAVTGAIMCDAGTCGSGSSFSKATLPSGAHYALQGVGIDYGIGNNNPNTLVLVNPTNTQWAVVNTQTQQITQTFTPVRTPVIPVAPITVPKIETTTATATITDTKTVTVANPNAASVITITKTQDAFLSAFTKILNAISSLMLKLGISVG